MFHGSGWWSYMSADESKGKPHVDRALLGRVLAYARPYWIMVSVLLATIIAGSLLGLLPPLLFRDLIDHVLPTANVRQLNLIALALVAIPLVSGLIDVLGRYASARAGEGVIFDLRQQMYEHLQSMAIRFFTTTRAGEIMSRFNSDVVGAQNAITGTLPNIVTNLVTLVSTLVVMISIEWRLALLSVVVLPLFLLPAKRVARTLRDIRRRSMEYNADMSSHVGETLSINGALLVKTFGRWYQEINKFKGINRNVREVGIRQALVGRWFFMGLGLASAVGVALVYWLGGHLVLRGAITVGTIVAFTAYLTRLYGPIQALSNVQVDFATSMVSFERVFLYLNLPAEIKDRPGAVELAEAKGHIQFEHVSFSYLAGEEQALAAAIGAAPATNAASGNGSPAAGGPSAARTTAVRPDGDGAQAGEDGVSPAPVPTRRWALRDVSFDVEPGQLVALVGRSGAGKTTITYLLPRLYDPTEGSICLDGHDLRDVTLESLARQIGMVTQETYLFHDTVRANLLYAKPEATQEELEAACRAASIHDFIAGLPEGYDTLVGERGYRLSGGEKQRLAIARVILKDPRLLILDEATSHLDSHNEALIQAALEPLFAGRTSVVIAHRLSTILASDKILVFDEGHLIEEGTHAELLAKGGLYAHLYETQFRGAAVKA